MSNSIYTTNSNGEAAMRVSQNVTGNKDSIYGVDASGKPAVRVVGDGASGGGSSPAAPIDAVLKDVNSVQVMTGGLQVRDELQIAGTDNGGAVAAKFTVVLVQGVPTIIAEKGIDVTAETKFDKNPKSDDVTSFDAADGKDLVTKSQVQQAMVAILPAKPSEGEYVLGCTVDGEGNQTLQWVAK